MRIVDLLKKQSIDLNASVADKAAAIDHLVDLMAAGGNLNDKELYKQRVLAREQEGSTTKPNTNPHLSPKETDTAMHWNWKDRLMISIRDYSSMVLPSR